jgi:hypothetical protein
MPASRAVKSKYQPKGKAFAQELTYHEKVDRNGSISFIPLPVPTSPTSPSVSASPLASQPSTQLPVSHKRAVRDVEVSLDQDIGVSKKPRKPTQVFCSFPIILSITINPT